MDLLYPIDQATDKASREFFGGKGFGLYEMAQADYPVPPALVIPTTAYHDYHKDPAAFRAMLVGQMPAIRAYFVKHFGTMPLLSIRSGARVSMPGMMDTILNVGLDDTTYPEYAKHLGANTARNCYTRLIQMYGSVVDGVDHKKLTKAVSLPTRLKAYQKLTGHAFPSVDDQIVNAVEAVFKSWDNDRAKHYRKMHAIPDDWGTACVIQAMVFGNRNDKSATGVLFTRNPDSGKNVMTGEFLVNAQGEDVVDGSHTPRPITEMADWNFKVSEELFDWARALENKAGFAQDIEFTVEDGKLYLLQTRNAKLSARATVRTAMDMLAEGMIGPHDARSRVTRKVFAQLMKPVIDPSFTTKPHWTGIPACSGIVTGKVVHTAGQSIASKEPCILVTKETNPNDIAGMEAAAGILTMTGGSTSHAAVVARSMNKPTVVGLSQDLTSFPLGSKVTIDGSTGHVWVNVDVPVIRGGDSPEVTAFIELLATSEDVRLIGETNTPVLDVSDMTPDAAVEAVRGTLGSMELPTILVDVRSDARDPDLLMFLRVQSPEKSIVERLSTGLSDAERKRIAVISSGTIPNNLDQVPTVTTLEGLLEVTTEKFVYAGPTHAAAARVLEWMRKDGQSPIALGLVAPGGYASRYQLVDKLLT